MRWYVPAVNVPPAGKGAVAFEKVCSTQWPAAVTVLQVAPVLGAPVTTPQAERPPVPPAPPPPLVPPLPPLDEPPHPTAASNTIKPTAPLTIHPMVTRFAPRAGATFVTA